MHKWSVLSVTLQRSLFFLLNTLDLTVVANKDILRFAFTTVFGYSLFEANGISIAFVAFKCSVLFADNFLVFFSDSLSFL